MRRTDAVRLLLCLLCGLLASAALFFSASTVSAAGQYQQGHSMRLAANSLLSAINRDRAAHGVGPLTLDYRQSRCSRQHSRHMMLAGSLSHDQFPADICVPNSLHGENVGWVTNQTVPAALAWMHQQMMREGPCPPRGCSPAQFEAHGHYINLLDPAFTRVGIGIALHTSAVWLTEDFLR